MNWFFIALGAPFLWALVNISDQYLVAKYSDSKRSSAALVLFSSLVGIFVAGGIAIFSDGIFEISNLDKLLLFSSGILMVVWVIFYLFTLKIEDVSAVVPWFLTVPILGYILGYIFLGETLTVKQILGALVVFLGASILSISFKESGKRYFKKNVAVFMISACVLIALIGVMFKYVTAVENFWVSSFWVHVGLGFSGIIIYIFIPQYRIEFIKMIKKGSVGIFTLNAISEITSIIGNFLSNYALLLAPITMVYLVGSFQPGIVLLLTLFCTRFLPNVAKENMSKQVLIPKIIAITIMITGSIFLFL